ncbi:MAG: CRTAC1 family protein, partial [Candidatus Latescibacterota bacterium]
MGTLIQTRRVTGIVLTWLLAGSLSDGAAADSGTAFVDVTREVGVNLIATRGTTFGDYDNDGWPDLLATENLYGGAGTAVALLGNQGNGVLRDDAAALPAGIGERLKGGGCIFGDYDNDGDLDAFIPVGAFKSKEAGRNLLLRNDRGRFVDVAVQAGLTDEVPTDNAVWFDYDRDGNLDLYVGNMACDPPECAQELRNALYRNHGDGTFTDRTAETGLLHSWTLETGCMPNGSNGGLLAADFSDDGWPDLYVSMYGGANLLFLSQGDGRFVVSTSAAIGDRGRNWGAAVGDVDNDGDLDLVQTSRAGGPGAQSQLLVNQGGGVFVDGTYAAGLAALTAQDVLGCALGDIDNDGDLDLLTGDKHFLFVNDGHGVFTSATGGSGIAEVWLGLSLGDYDLDGDLDAWYGSAGEGGQLYRNETSGNHWLIVELVGVRSNRTGIGARVIVTTHQRRQTREVSGGMGYCQHEPVAHFGLGQDQMVDELEIRWPSGQVVPLLTVPGNQRIRVIEGSGRWETVTAAAWEVAPQATPIPAEGATVRVYGILRSARFSEAAVITRVTADLSALGGPAEVALTSRSHGRYRLDTTFVAATPAQVPSVVATVEQSTPLGPHWARVGYAQNPPLTPPVQLVSDQTADVLLFNDGEGDTQYDGDIGSNFSASTSDTMRVVYDYPDAPVFRGAYSASFTVAPEATADWFVWFYYGGSGCARFNQFPGVRYLHL